VGNDQYRGAIEAAERELDEITEQIDALAQRRAQLQQTLSALRVLLGEETDSLKVTENIRIIIQASSVGLSATEVLEALRAMGVVFAGKNPIASVQTILARMAGPDGELERAGRADGTLVYAWRKASMSARRRWLRPGTATHKAAEEFSRLAEAAGNLSHIVPIPVESRQAEESHKEPEEPIQTIPV